MTDKDDIPLLSAHQFASLHLQHTLDHPPDHVLFPFLHGLEGDNHAQNTFFASSSFAASAGSGSKYNNNHNNNHNGYAHNDNYRIVPKVPKYRGLVWVACEDDLERAGDYTTLRILRRKPALTPQEQQQLEEEMSADVLGSGAAAAAGSSAGTGIVSDSSSSEGLSDESSSYEDEDEDLELDEDEQEMLRMIEADQAAAGVAAGAMHLLDAGITQHLNGKPLNDDSSMGTLTLDLNSHSPENGNGNKDANAPSLALDEDDEDNDSLLASPVQIHIPMGMEMQVDSVHVVQSGEGEGLENEEYGVNVETAAGETGSALLDGPVAGKKDEKHFEGTHMHPVAHRPALGSASTVTPNSINSNPNNITAQTAVGLGLGINTNTNTSGNPINHNHLSAVQDPTLISPLSPSSAASSSASLSSHSHSTSPVVSSPGSAVPSSPGSVIGDADADQTEVQMPPTMLESPAQDPEAARVQLQQDEQQQQEPAKRKSIDPTAPPLFTSTFRPKELLRRARGTKLRLDLRGLGGASYSNHNGNGDSKSRSLKVNTDTITSWAGGSASSRSGGVEPGTTLEEEEGWEFVPARVPDGISLRNFGIQVPIYATLSDIVVYSPYGATPAAKALARRFKAAIKAKRAERLQAAGLGMDLDGQELEEEDTDDDDVDSPSGIPEQDAAIARAKAEARKEREQRKIEMAQLREAQSDFLKYDVYVLDAGEEEMRSALPHLMMRVCGAGVPGGLGVGLNAGGGGESGSGSKKQQDTEVESKEREKEEKVMDMDIDVDVVGDMDIGGEVGDVMDVDTNMEAGPSSSNEPKADDNDVKEKEDDLVPIANTVDFALREREEMRDLTKASEIISLRPTPLPTLPNPSASFASSIPFVQAGTSIWSHTPLVTPAAASTPSLLSAAAYENSPAPKSMHPSEVDNELAQPPYDPRIGQVYLGNSGDVPLAPDVGTHFRNVAALPRGGNSEGATDEDDEWDWESLISHLKGVEGLLEDCGIDEKELLNQETPAKKGKPLADDDPFNYLPTNDPASGFGYDICVECHDLAPFPSSSHLRAAEDHMAMLDTLWRERWDKMLAAKRKRQGKPPLNQGSSQQQVYPPRPPPNANAVIHLPFPSSPSNSQATMASLMPVIRFLERWIQPLPVSIIQPPPPISPPLTLSPPVEVPRPVTPPELKNLMMISNVDPKKNMAGVVSAAPTPPPPTTTSTGGSSSRRWSSVTALMPSFPIFPGSAGASNNNSTAAAASAKEKEQTSNPPPTPPPVAPLPPHPSRLRSFTSPSSSFHNPVLPTPVQARTRPLKILMYSSDGYTESSVPALCLLMAIKGLMLPEAYLELQVEKRRSFFVYQPDLGILRRVEGRLREEREREKEKERERERERERIATGQYLSSLATAGGGSINANGKRTAPASVPHRGSSATPSARPPSAGYNSSGSFMGRPAAKSISFAQAPPVQGSIQTGVSINPLRLPSSQSTLVGQAQQPLGRTQFEFGSAPVPGSSILSNSSSSPNIGIGSGQQAFGSTTATNQQQKVIKGRPRATTSPWLPSLFGGDHQSWFNDPRFDGSFPSRVLPFLYLGNLNHASNVYMLHALGITHVVSVGECALVPPPHHTMHGGASNGSAVACHRPGPGAHFVPGKGPGGQGSLWIEEREGRIKVLDIKGVCDDGIDTLEPQLEPICDWIDKARQEGGQVLVHCRVGVSRSATVTIAYVMKHLGLPLVDAYLIVRSRRLSVLIQPNMRLLYNLCGWEIKLAKERTNGDERKLKKELARALTWPYLAKEVHALNEKYLH